MARTELQAVIDYILNKADEREFEVILKACERKRRDQGKYAALGGLNPGALAEKMASSVQEGVTASMEGLRNTVRDYVARIVRQKEPGASDMDIEALLDEVLPDRSAAPGVEEPGLASDALPPEALAMMIRDFADYSLGMMPPSRQQELWERMPDWQNLYWKTFPPEIRAFIKARLEGRLQEDEFWSAVFSVLGL
jgi:hypothetical protein